MGQEEDPMSSEVCVFVHVCVSEWVGVNKRVCVCTCVHACQCICTCVNTHTDIVYLHESEK